MPACTCDLRQEVLSFCCGRPLWQQDAARRLAVSGCLNDQDRAEIVALCKCEHGLVDPGPTPVPLVAGHLPATNVGATCVNLCVLRDLKNVNALLDGQKLTFLPLGVTVVYGDNGAGKSGYARVIRRVCRHRGKPLPVDPDVFRDAGPAPAAFVEYAVDQSPQQFAWSEGTAAPDELSFVRFFDSQTGAAQVREELQVEFLPPGLDLLAALAGVVKSVKAELEKEKEADRAAAVSLVGFSPATKCGAFVTGLSAKSSVDELNRLAVWSDADAADLDRVRVRLAELRSTDPTRKAAEHLAAAKRANALSVRLDRLLAALGDAVADGIRDALLEARRLDEAASKASLDVIAGEPVSAAGSPEWALLWDAARRFSKAVAYPAAEFPVTEQGAVCVLCHQELGDPARAWLRRFATFLQEGAATAAADARQKLNGLVTPLQGLRVEESGDEALCAELDALSEGLGKAVHEFLEGAAKRAKTLESCASNLIELGGLTPLASDLGSRLTPIVTAAETKAAELAGQNAAEAIAKCQGELAELEDRKRLAEQKVLVEAEIDRAKRLVAWTGAVQSAATTAISKKHGALTEVVVTEEFRSAFREELEALAVEYGLVELAKTKSQEAATFHRVKLTPSPKVNVSIERVLSEGEQKAIALAGFFAEVRLSPGCSGVVLDDPVTSLDHARRTLVAKRIVDLAKKRQVVVFTHDMVFMLLLQQLADGAGVAQKPLHVRRQGTRPGLCSDGHPWEGMTTKNRIAWLKDRLQTVAAMRATADSETYKADISRIYGKLRETWERAVEEVLLNGAVYRFGYEVQTQRLKAVDIVADDYTAIEQGMATCSKLLEGHDQAGALGTGVPTPRDVAADINRLVDWIVKIAIRRPAGNFPKPARLNEDAFV